MSPCRSPALLPNNQLCLEEHRVKLRLKVLDFLSVGRLRLISRQQKVQQESLGRALFQPLQTPTIHGETYSPFQHWH